jgi:hypothetical protein
MVLVELFLWVISRPESLLDLLVAAGGKDEGGQAHWTLTALGEFLAQRFKVLVQADFGVIETAPRHPQPMRVYESDPLFVAFYHPEDEVGIKRPPSLCIKEADAFAARQVAQQEDFFALKKPVVPLQVIPLLTSLRSLKARKTL